MNKQRPLIAYYLVEKNGGYEVYSIHIEEGVVLENTKITDADAWDQTIGLLEQALSKQFA